MPAEQLFSTAIRYRGEEPVPDWDSTVEGPGLWRLPVMPPALWPPGDPADVERKVLAVSP